MQAQAGAVEDQVEQGEDQQAETDDHQAVQGQGQDFVDLPGTGHPGRGLHRAVEGREDRPHQLLQDEADAEGRQQGLQGAAIEKTDHPALDEDAHQAGDDEGRGDGEEEREADVARQQLLDDVGGVGPQHHQLAMGHVDDPHDAEGDGEADGRQHQHRAQGEAEEQGLKLAVPVDATLDMRQDAAGGGLDLTIGLALQELGQGGAHRGVQGIPQAGEGGQARLGIRAVEVQQGQHQAQGIPHLGGVLLGQASAQQVRVGAAGIAHQTGHRRQPPPGVGVAQVQARQGGLELAAHAIVEGDLFQLLGTDAAERGVAQDFTHRLVALLAARDHQAAIGLELIEFAREQGGEQALYAGIATGGQSLHGLLLDREFAIEQQGQGGGEGRWVRGWRGQGGGLRGGGSHEG